MPKISLTERFVVITFLISGVLISAGCDGRIDSPETEMRLRPYAGNAYYWQYRGEPLLLIGASDYHNIFQRPDMAEHMELMQSVGGNYVRNSMASREIFPDHRDLWPFAIVEATEDSLINIYDLTQWNDDYWQRLQNLLEETAARDIILEIELWERHDYYRTRDQAGWIRHPYNPANNINYTAEDTGFPTDEITAEEGHPFFSTVPELNNNEVVLPYQQAFIDKILTYTLEYDHLMYNMNNETREPNEWGEYWGNYIVAQAEEAGVEIEMTDMQDAHDVTDESVARMMDSELFTFVDISQNNFQSGDVHWDRIQYIRDYLQDNPKPITNIKVYGTDQHVPPVELWGTGQDGIERFWRNILGGTSSTRFHRPPWGIGLNDSAQAHVQSMRMLADAMHIFTCEPRNDLLSDRESNEAYLMAEPQRQYALYFPNGGSVSLDLSDSEGAYSMRWLNLAASQWSPTEAVAGGEPVAIQTPADGHWLAVILRGGEL